MEQKDHYKEMYLHLYRKLEILQCICDAASVVLDDTHSDSAGLYLDHRDHLAFPNGKDEFMQKLKELLKNL